MTETQDKKPDNKPETYTQPGKPRLSDLEAKRAQNLRKNLMKRKQQARARDNKSDFPLPKGEGQGEGIS